VAPDRLGQQLAQSLPRQRDVAEQQILELPYNLIGALPQAAQFQFRG